MRNRTRVGLALAGATLLLTGLPGAASAAAGFTSSVASGPPGTVITVASTEPCLAPPAGETLTGVGVVVLDAYRSVGEADMKLNADRSWSGSVTIAADARNGEYQIRPICTYSKEGAFFVYNSDPFVVTSAPGTQDPVLRLAGADRITTAITTSQDLVPDDGSLGAVVLSRADSYADALAGTPLATLLGSPLLLTGQAALDARTQAEITRLLVPGGEVHLLGGTAAISEAVATKITSLGFKVVRYAGTNRYDTAVKIASIGVKDPTAVLLATGGDFRAGLVAGVAAPFADLNTADGYGVVLLTDGSKLPPETDAYLQTLGSVPRYAVGAPAAAAVPSATKLVGADDAETSVIVAERFSSSSRQVGIASSAGFPDLLSGGAHAAAHGAPLLLTAPASLAPSVSTFLTGRKANIVIGFVYGGTAVVSDAARNAAAAAIN